MQETPVTRFWNVPAVKTDFGAVHVVPPLEEVTRFPLASPAVQTPSLAHEARLSPRPASTLAADSVHVGNGLPSIAVDRRTKPSSVVMMHVPDENAEQPAASRGPSPARV